MYDLILKELTEGCEEYPGVKAGFVGEVGSSWPITGNLIDKYLNIYLVIHLFMEFVI